MEYVSGMEGDGRDSDTLISTAIKEAQLDDSMEEEQDEEVDELMEIAEYGIEKAEMGLMSRPDMTMTGEE